MSKVSKLFYSCSIIAIIVTAINTANAATTSRPTSANAAAANRTQNRTPSTSVRMPTAVQTVQAQTTVAEVTEYDTEPDVVEIAEPDPEPVIIVDNKTSMFNDIFADLGANSTDSSSSEFADMINKQRALLDASSTKTAQTSSGITTANACDKGLRDCMTEKCGTNFTKCAKDSTTVWGNKMDSCRRKTKCTSHEYTLLAPEILADRDAYIKLSYYQSVVDCGYKYNECIFDICGTTLDKCLSKSAGDSAIAKCNSIARECKEQDSGLAGRVMGIFGDLRTIATAQVQKDEKRLYEIRDLMRAQCNRFGAMFDERTLDCVYTVNFFAGADTEHPMASKKLYSGDSFQCNANWFGIDVTTYKENAYRLTRSQKGASAAALGAGVGTAAGLLTSGAIGRALDTQKADKAAEEACIADGGEWVGNSFSGKHCEKKNGGTGNNGEQNGNDKYSNLPSHVQTLYNGFDQSGVTDLANAAVTCLGYGKDECTPENGCQWDEEKGCLALQDNNKGLTLACEGRPQDKCKGNCKWEKGQCVADQDKGGSSSDKQNEEACTINGLGKWDTNANPQCVCTYTDMTFNKNWGTCLCPNKNWNESLTQKAFESPKIFTCRRAGGTWKNNTCKCDNTTQSESDTVDIDLYVTDNSGKVNLSAKVDCNGKTSTTSEHIKLKGIKSDTECIIYADNCETTTVKVTELKDKNYFRLTNCKDIDKCTKDGGTWNKKDGFNGGTCTVDLNGLYMTSSWGQGYGLSATIKCGNMREQSVSADKKINLKKVPLETTCNIKANGCTTKDVSAQELSKDSHIKMECDYIDNCLSSGGTLPEKKDINNNVSCTCPNTKPYNSKTHKCDSSQGTTTSRNANSNNNANNNTNIENLTFLGGCYKYLDDSTQIIPVPISNGDKYTSECNNVNSGDWVVTFSNNIKVTGTSICQKGTQTQDTCYCKGNSSQEWINMKQIDHDKCYGGCPYSCIELMQSNKNNFRKRITNQ